MKRSIIFLIAIVSSCCSVMAQSNNRPADEDRTSFITKVLAEDVCFIDRQVAIESLPWNPHPTYKGVSLKHLIVGKDTGNQLSCHIVRVEPDCILETHQHDGKIEIHEVVDGDGIMYLDDKEINYSVGQVCVIPANTLHKVVAGKNGLYLFAKFTPALQ